MLRPNRRSFLLGSASAGLGALAVGPLAGCATPQDLSQVPPVVFVHGNGDTAALWHTTFWRWETNGFHRNHLFAVDFPYPLARSADAAPQRLRSSTTEQREQLAEIVDEVMRRTGAAKVALVGSSRGGNAIRSYIRLGGGAGKVSHAVLCGTPNHGVIASDKFLVGSEFNGASAFLKSMNEPAEITPGPAWMTTLSDSADKYAQPDGRYLGMPGTPTGVGYDGPALKGARNVILPGLDHREVAFAPEAFAAIWQFITGAMPAQAGIVTEASLVLNGKVNDMPGGVPTNLPVAGAVVEVWETDPSSGARRRMVHRRETGTDGYWGPFTGSTKAAYEFVVTTPGAPVTHIYRSPFPRSSAIIHLRAGKLSDEDRKAGSVVILDRPRGYFDGDRDTVLMDGQRAPGIPAGVPTVSTATLRLPPGPARAVTTQFNAEQIAVQTWPAAEGHVSIAELHY
ncbi:alpha/beta fold hydrolase [Ferrovibrio sp.]|uniref:alpha/beta fold hydrolase n=1 Tax=Ferrovibrio sp. TaxID=1917215 RepID=UPI0035116352